ncbi:glutamate ABC transporter substrate-binding protein [Candidatus Protofrankia datiscae]|uniref:glutamate ABC transporter substrate-binding protein n=1 Tax=Candidatus Protofrankia datiscae TaxID=2716812 RepID=UPI000A0191E4|nr:glutamate ABC transporter substrate-binding protein [Candidatus Protofrankia datiscae]
MRIPRFPLQHHPLQRYPRRGRRLVTAVLAGTVALAAAGCGSDTTGTEAETPAKPTFAAGTTAARLAEAGKVTVGTKFDQPLFGLKGLGGDVEGFDVEIAKIIADGLGIDPDDITFVETPSAQREGAIQQSRVDFIVATYTINDKRKQLISFAGPYYQAGQDIMVKKDNTTITGPESLRATNAKVCSVSGSTPAEKIKEYADASNIVLFDVYSKCADALRTGQVDAVTTDNVVLLGLVDASGGAFKIVGKPFTTEPYGIGIKKGDTAFCQFIDEQLTAAAADGRYAKAWESTAGKVAGAAPALPTLATCS